MIRFLPRLLLVLAVLALGCGDERTNPGAPAATTAAGDGSGTKPRPAGRALRYGVVGDSNSNGEGVSPADAWPERLARRLTEDGLPVEVVVNAAMTGYTAEQAISEELPAFEQARPDVGTLMIGPNDWVNFVSEEQYRARVRALLTAMVKTVGDPGRVIVVTSPDFSVTPTGKQYAGERDATAGMEAFNGIMREEGEAAGVEVVDIFDLSQEMTDPTLVADDGLHASAKELELWTDRIAPVAKRRWAEFAR